MFVQVEFSPQVCTPSWHSSISAGERGSREKWGVEEERGSDNGQTQHSRSLIVLHVAGSKMFHQERWEREMGRVAGLQARSGKRLHEAGVFLLLGRKGNFPTQEPSGKVGDWEVISRQTFRSSAHTKDNMVAFLTST